MNLDYVGVDDSIQTRELNMISQFSFVEAIDLEIVTDEGDKGLEAKNFEQDALYATLLREFEQLPEESDEEKLDGLAVINVAPSVVPNPFVPGLRIFSYNVSADALMEPRRKREHGHRRGRKGDKGSICKAKPYDSSWKCHLNEPWHSDADAPSRKNQALTPLGYAQVQ
jgi:endopolyphosphatase